MAPAGHGAGRGGERLPPHTDRGRLGRAKHRQLISFCLANILGVSPKPAPKQINKEGNPSDFLT